MRGLGRELAAEPSRLDLALEVARRYLALGRAEGDPRYLGLAQGALRPWWAEREPPATVRLVRAGILRAQHDFAGSRADLDAVLAADPNDVQAQLDRAALLEALGDLDGAERACARVKRLRRGLAGEACEASASSLGGLARQAHDDLVAALAAPSAAGAGVRLWALTTLGEIATRLGDAAAAERHFREATALGRRDVYLIADYADLLLDQGRDADTARLLAGEGAADTLLLRKAIAARRLGDPAAEGMRRTLADRFAAVRLRGDVPHLREEARLALELEDDPPRALRLARDNWDRQRGPADARVLLQAALASGEPAAGRPVLDWMDDTGIEDAALAALAARVGGAAS